MKDKAIFIVAIIITVIFMSGVTLHAQMRLDEGGFNIPGENPDNKVLFSDIHDIPGYAQASEALPARLYLQPDGAMSVTPYSQVKDQDVYVNGKAIEWKYPTSGSFAENEFELTLIGGSHGIYGTVFLAELLLKSSTAGQIQIDTTSFFAGAFYTLPLYNIYPRVMKVDFGGDNPSSQIGDTLIVRLRVISGAAGKIMYGTSTGINFLSTVPPNMPILSSPFNGSENQPLTLNMAWNPVEGALKYWMQVSPSSEFTTFQYTDSSITTNSKQIGGLTGNSTYYWRVRAQDHSGWGPWSEPWNFTTERADPPVAPSLLSPSDNAQDQELSLSLRWQSDDGPARYHLQVSSSAQFESLIIDNSTLVSNSMFVSGLTPSTVYFWRVRARNQYGWGPWSEPWNFTTERANTPDAPALATPADGAQDQELSLRLRWQSDDNPASYHLQVSSSAQFQSLIIDNSTLVSNSMLVSGLTPSTVYFWRVRARNQYGWGPWSASWSFSTISTPAAPKNLTAFAGDGYVKLTWNKSEDSRTERYRVYMRTAIINRTLVDSSTGGLSDTTKIIFGLMNDEQYFFTVTAVDNSGIESGMSNEVNAIPFGTRIRFHQPDDNLGIQEASGQAGFAWGDYDGDGFLDLFLSGYDHSSVVYRNTGSSFDQNSFTEDVGKTTGAIWADFNGDGFLDLLITNDLGLDLYLGDGIGQFTSITEISGLDSYFASGQYLWMASSADYDRDGDLDIVFAGGDRSAGPIRLLTNEDGIFYDVASARLSPNRSYESWNPAWVDVDNDSDVDLWIPTIRTQGSSCGLYLNQDGLLAETPSVTSGLAASSAIASAWGDYNNDGYVDLLVVPYQQDNDGGVKLFRNNKNGTFTDVAADCGLDFFFSDVRGLCWGDYDNDGKLDLLIVHRNSPHQLFRNNGERFDDVGLQVGFNFISQGSRSGMFVDFNNDGFLDIFFSADFAVKTLLQSNAENENNWIGIIPIGSRRNKSAIGARIFLYTDGRSQIRDIQAGAGGITNGDLRAHFGIGSYQLVDSVKVAWPNGRMETYENLPINQYVTLTEADVNGAEKSDEKPQFDCRLQNNYPNPFNPSTQLLFSVERETFVSLKVYDAMGKEVVTIVSETLQPGDYERYWIAEGMPGGIYFIRMQTDSFTSTRKMVLLK